jgi:hypothetical protein
LFGAGLSVQVFRVACCLDLGYASLPLIQLRILDANDLQVATLKILQLLLDCG